MERLTMTPFGRQPVSAGLLATQALAEAEVSVPRHQKWELFRDLVTGRVAFGVTDRDLAVLNALLTFHRSDDLDADENLIVFPSNAALSNRAHGMAESTLRRHLAALVKAGLISRHDSPNGKRYAKRDRSGDLLRAFGFDLRPLLVRAQEIAQAAQAAQEASDRLKAQRERCVLISRDLTKLIRYALQAGLDGDWDGFDARLTKAQMAFRRRLCADDLDVLEKTLKGLSLEVQEVLHQAHETDIMSGNDMDCGRHQQTSKPTPIEFEPSLKKARVKEVPSLKPAEEADPKLPLALIAKACPEILMYGDGHIQSWHELVSAASFVRGMMGISLDAWTEAIRIMGEVDAAIAVACVLERIDQINNPGGYLRALTSKAADGAFSTGPMVMALLNTGKGKVA